MRKTLTSTVVILAATTLAAAAPPAPPSKNCVELAQAFVHIDKANALTWTESVGDNSAPRETNRQLKLLNGHTRQLIILEAMRAQSCQLPNVAGGYSQYLGKALECQTDIIRDVKDSPKCDLKTW